MQTIHAFCTRLLHQFPFEADAGAGFEVLDDATQSQMLETLTLDVMLEGAANPGTRSGGRWQMRSGPRPIPTFRELISEAVGRRDGIEQWVARTGSVDAAMRNCRRRSASTRMTAPRRSRRDRWGGHRFGQWPDLAAVFLTGRQNRQEAGSTDQAGVAGERGEPPRELPFDLLHRPNAAFETRYARQHHHGHPRRVHPDWGERLDQEKDRICALLDTLRAVECRDRTRALITVAHEVIVRYRREKVRRGLLDYDDLIDRTLALFRRTSAAWVLYKLDLGINHLLLDEAQDTSPKQWEIIQTLVRIPGGRRRAQRQTDDVRGRRRQAVDLLVSGRGAGKIR